MTDDLVTRLRASRVVWENGGHRPTDDELEAAARIEQQAATIARLEGERERLALAICGGEDAPGYANAQTVEALEKVARDNASAAMWQIDRTMTAEAKLAQAVTVLRGLCDEWGKSDPGTLFRAHNAARAFLDSEDRKGGEWAEEARAATAAAKENKDA